MNKLSMALTALLVLVMIAFMAPNILALNRGKILRNIALWLGIFAAIGLLYQFLYGTDRPLAKEGFLFNRAPAQQHKEAPPPADSKNNGTYGFSPPGE
jgi:hypothetical protein